MAGVSAVFAMPVGCGLKSQADMTTGSTAALHQRRLSINTVVSALIAATSLSDGTSAQLGAQLASGSRMKEQANERP